LRGAAAKPRSHAPIADRFEDDQLSTIGVDLKIKLLDVEPAQPGGKPRRV